MRLPNLYRLRRLPRLPRVPVLVWMSLPLLLLLGACLLLLASPAAQAQAADRAEGGCRPTTATVTVVVDDASRPLDPRDPHFAEKLAARYRALNLP